jgi:hypothetical protein
MSANFLLQNCMQCERVPAVVDNLERGKVDRLFSE